LKDLIIHKIHLVVQRPLLFAAARFLAAAGFGFHDEANIIAWSFHVRNNLLSWLFNPHPSLYLHEHQQWWSLRQFLNYPAH
jgi:hypothetical protein